jgi:hypothetical protein
VILLHAFEELDQDKMSGHLEHWFGHPQAGGHPWPAVCFCGADIFVLSRKDEPVGIVWHTGEWRNDVASGQ